MPLLLTVYPLVGKPLLLANLGSLPLANVWLASAHIASGNSLPLANNMFASGKFLTAGKPKEMFASDIVFQI